MMTPVTNSAPSRRGPGRSLIIGAAVLIGLAIIAGVAGVVVGLRQMESMVEDLDRVGPQGGRITLTAGEHTIYAEYPGAEGHSGGQRIRLVREGNEVPVRTSAVTYYYSWGGREGRSIGAVSLDEPGVYELDPVGSSADGYAIGAQVDDGALTIIGLGVVAGFVLGATGIILLIVGLTKRSRARRAFWGAGPG